MAKARKDLRGRALKPGEIQRKDDQRYMGAFYQAEVNHDMAYGACEA